MGVGDDQSIGPGVDRGFCQLQNIAAVVGVAGPRGQLYEERDLLIGNQSFDQPAEPSRFLKYSQPCGVGTADVQFNSSDQRLCSAQALDDLIFDSPGDAHQYPVSLTPVLAESLQRGLKALTGESQRVHQGFLVGNPGDPGLRIAGPRRQRHRSASHETETELQHRSEDPAVLIVTGRQSDGCGERNTGEIGRKPAVARTVERSESVPDARH